MMRMLHYVLFCVPTWSISVPDLRRLVNWREESPRDRRFAPVWPMEGCSRCWWRAGRLGTGMMGEWGEQRNGREMGSAVTYTYSPELQTDSGQILRIRGARLELIANVWPGTWILGWMFVSGHGSPGIIPTERVIPSVRYLCWPWCPKTSIVSADNRTTVVNHGTRIPGKKKKKKKLR